MLIGSRFMVLAASVAAVLAGMVLVVPGWLAETAQTLSRVNTQWVTFSEEENRRQDLEWKIEMILDRLKAKEEIIQTLIEERITLVQAAARFRYLNSQPANFTAVYAQHSGVTVEERNCRQVINWVQAKLNGRPVYGTEDLVDRLERELYQLLRRPGGIELPAYQP